MHCLAVYNQKGGVGKSTTAVNIATMAAGDGWSVLLWDLDAQGAATYLLGEESADVKPRKLAGVDQAIGRLVVRTKVKNLDLLASSQKMRNMDVRLGEQKNARAWLQHYLSRLGETYRLVVIDSPPSSGLLAESILIAATMVLVPVLPTPLAIRAANNLTAQSTTLGARAQVRPFFNMVDRRKSEHRQIAAAPAAYLENASPVTIPASVQIEAMGRRRLPLRSFVPDTHIAQQSFVALWRDVSRQLSTG